MLETKGIRARRGYSVCVGLGALAACLAAQTSPAAAQSTTQAQPADSASEDEEEIVVTAQKREERLIDVPVPVSVLDGQALGETNQLRIQDFYTRVPGVQLSREQNFQYVAIRGVISGRAANPTVGILIDDIPYGSTTNLGGGNVVPDIDPSDLARIEVLRGPQGTLYGASSMGGLLKFVTVDPSTSGVSGRLQAGISSVENSGTLGYDLRGSINVPIAPGLAARFSAFTHRDPGYIDNPIRGFEDVNEQQVYGGRVSLLWSPSDNVRLRLAALYQRTEGDGLYYVYVLPGLGDLEQNNRPDTGVYTREVQAYSAILEVDLGGATLTSLTGYNVNPNYSLFDYDVVFGPTTQANFGVAGSNLITDVRPEKFSQEVRLSSDGSRALEWIVGGFYTHESTEYVQFLDAIDPANNAFVARGATLSFPTSLDEYAVFGSLTYHFTDELDLQVGGRQSFLRQTTEQTVTGVFTPLLAGGLASPAIFPEVRARSDVFTYSVTPRWRITPNLMVYARVASGYRPGGANLSPGGVAPAQFDPDRTVNYELGVKGEFIDRRLILEASLYRIDWSDIQLQAVNPVSRISYNFNGDNARSQGLEISAQARPWQGASLSGWVVWSDAELTRDLPTAISGTTFGQRGDRLPFSTRFSAFASFDQEFPIGGDWNAHGGVSMTYVGERLGTYRGLSGGVPLPRQVYEAYTTFDLRAGVRNDDWSLTAYVNNVGDRRGIVSGGAGFTPASAFSVIQPRTMGLTLARNF